MKRLFTIVALFMAASSFSQKVILTQTLKGTVIDQLSGFGISNVSVRVEGISPAITALTDSAGMFRLTEVPIGRRQVRATSVGYEDAFLSAIEVTSSKEVVLEIKLNEKIARLD